VPQAGDKPDFQWQHDRFTDWLSISANVRGIILGLFGFDVFEWLLQGVTGDWDGLWRCGEVRGQAAGATQAIGQNLQAAARDLLTAWEGNAADACQLFLYRLAAGVAGLADHYRAMGLTYFEAGRVAYAGFEILSELAGELLDLLLEIGALVAIDAGRRRAPQHPTHAAHQCDALLADAPRTGRPGCSATAPPRSPTVTGRGDRPCRRAWRCCRRCRCTGASPGGTGRDDRALVATSAAVPLSWDGGAGTTSRGLPGVLPRTALSRRADRRAARELAGTHPVHPLEDATEVRRVDRPQRAAIAWTGRACWPGSNKSRRQRSSRRCRIQPATVTRSGWNSLCSCRSETWCAAAMSAGDSLARPRRARSVVARHARCGRPGEVLWP
jgi:hypothetical protein